MQPKELKKSPIKQRILQFVDSLGISKRDFYSKTGISRGTLENNAGITEDTITKLFAVYKNINPFWLINGEGEMVKNATTTPLTINEEIHRLQRECYDKSNRIIKLLDENSALKKELEEMKKATE